MGLVYSRSVSHLTHHMAIKKFSGLGCFTNLIEKRVYLAQV